MKKILHISKYYYPFSGGTEQIARDVVLALKGEYEQKIIAFNDGKEDKADIVDGIEVTKCGCFTKIAAQSLSTSYGKQLHRVMKEFDPDIVVFHYPNPFVAALLLRELRNTKAKLVVYWHLDIVRQKYLKLLFNPQNRSLLARADKVIATSPNYIEGSKWLQSVKDKCIVVPNCINVERMTITPDIEKRAAEIREENKDKVTVIPNAWQHYERIGYDEDALSTYSLKKNNYYFSMCSLEPNKNFKWIAEEAKNNADMTFAVAGSINRKVFSEGLGFELPPNMKLLGFVSDEEAKTLMRDCRAFLFPTFYEGFGIPPLEAISAGAKQVVVSDTQVMHEIFGDGVIYVDPSNYNIELSDFPEISETRISELLKKYSWKKSAETLLKLLQNIDQGLDK